MNNARKKYGNLSSRVKRYLKSLSPNFDRATLSQPYRSWLEARDARITKKYSRMINEVGETMKVLTTSNAKWPAVPAELLTPELLEKIEAVKVLAES